MRAEIHGLQPENTVLCFDNGGVTADRYTVVYLRTNKMLGNGDISYDCRYMSKHPTHPQGVGMYGILHLPNPSVGEKVPFSELPVDCQLLVMKDLAELQK